MMKIENLKLTQEWDKTFPKSEKVEGVGQNLPEE